MKLYFPIGATRQGFSLLEVMIAIGIFFAGVFTILALVSTSLGNARRLQHPSVDADVIAAQLSITNQLVEGTYSGNLADLLGRDYAGYTWTMDVEEARTNKLFNVEVAIQSASGNREVISKVDLLLYRPQSPAGSLDGGNFIHK